MNFTAKNVYVLEKDKDLLPGKGIIPTDNNPIKALHCIKTPNAEVVMRTINGQKVLFPVGSFVQGAIYSYSIRQINEVGADCFLGLSD